MKNLLLAIAVLTIVSCQPATTNEGATDEPSFQIIDTQPSMYAVGLDTAKRNISYYDKVAKEALGVDPIKAFTIRSVDLAESIGLDVKYLSKAKYRHVRVYMGLDSASSQFKIYLTPVEGAKLSAGEPGKDVILTGPYSGDKKEATEDLGDGDGPFVLDFSSPCPNTCPDPIL